MKTLLKIFVVLTLILITGLLSCGKNKNPVSPTDGFTIDNFPHEIGTVWVYEYFHHDLASVHTDTLIVKVDDTTRITDDSLLVYVVTSENLSYLEKAYITFYWHIDNDTVTYYRPEADSFIVTQKLGFPLEVGAIWTTGTAIADSNEVTDISPITVLGKTYQNSYQITRHYDIIQELYIYYSYVPNIGLIHSTEFTPHINAPNPIWNLISFYEPDSLTLSDFPLQVGASWEYKVYDNLIDCFTECYDTCTVTILDSVMVRSGIIREDLLFDYPGQEIIKPVFRVDNRVSISWYNLVFHFSLEFPLYVGKRCNDNGAFFSSAKVLGRQTVTTEARTFKDAYYLKVDISALGVDGGTIHLWIAKGIGIVKLIQNSNFIDFSSEDMSWELKSYKPNSTIDSFTIDEFPNYDGMTRTYEVDKGADYSPDTVYVHVAESSLVALWTYTNSDSSWQELISIEENAVTFISSGRIQISYKSFLFPISIGNSWVTFPFENTTEVLIATTVETSAGRFSPCYALRTVYNCDDCTNEEIDWIYPSIGIVQKRIYNSQLGINETWTLIDYSNP